MKTLSAQELGKNRKFTKRQLQLALFLLTLLVPSLYPLSFPTKADASTPATVYYQLDRMAASSKPSGNVCVKPSTATGTESTLTLVMPSQFTMGATTDYTEDTSATNIPQGTTQWPSTSGNPSDVTGHTITFTVGDLTSASTTYCMHFTAGGSTSVGSAGSNLTGSIATDIDTTAAPYAVAVVSNDQVNVSATVPATFSFALSGGTAPGDGTTVALGTLSTSSVTSGTAITATVATNARNGWLGWIKGANANGLHSTTAGADISGVGTAGTTVTDLSSATGYGVGATINTNSSGSLNVSNYGYDSTSSTTKVGKLSNTTFETFGGATGPASGDIVNLAVRAKISATQQAASDYSDTLTVVASGLF